MRFILSFSCDSRSAFGVIVLFVGAFVIFRLALDHDCTVNA